MRAYFYIFIAAVCLFKVNPVCGQKTALLLIDIQDFYFPGGRLQLENPGQAGMNAGLVLDQFRKRGYPVFHVRHNFETGGDIHQYVKPREGEKVFSKDKVNAFLETDLLEALQQDSVQVLVICGMQTHMCVEAAVRAASDLGFECLLIEDACTTRTLQHDELIIPAKSVHFSTIQTLQGSYAKVITTSELFKGIDQFARH